MRTAESAARAAAKSLFLGEGGAMLSPPRTRPTAALPPECVRASRRGIEIITLPGAQAPHAVGRTRYTEKPPGTRSGRRLTLETAKSPVERLFPPTGGVSRGSVRVGGKTFLLPFYGFSFGYKRKGVNLTLLMGTAGDIVEHLICAHSLCHQKHRPAKPRRLANVPAWRAQ